MKKLALMTCTWLFAQHAFAGKCCHTPTIWTFKNTSKMPVSLACSLDSSSAAPADPVTMTTGPISAGASYEHSWGEAWNNDGMGLIPGHWSCRNIESKGRPADSLEVKFVTDWGENVLITWKDSVPSVAKIDVPTKPATKAKN